MMAIFAKTKFHNFTTRKEKLTCKLRNTQTQVAISIEYRIAYVCYETIATTLNGFLTLGYISVSDHSLAKCEYSVLGLHVYKYGSFVTSPMTSPMTSPIQ